MEQKDLIENVRDEIAKKLSNSYDETVFKALKQHGYSKEEILDLVYHT